MAVNSLNPRENRALHLCAALFFVASPLLIMLILSALAGQNMFLAKPYLNDEVDYWRVMYSVKACGLNFGSTEHLVGYTAPIGPLGSHGVSPLAAWLWYALLLPWTDSAIVTAGVIMLTAALALFTLIARPGTAQLFLLGLFTLLFPPLVRYINLSMMEMPCYAGVIVYAALLFRYEKEHSGALPKSRWVLPALVICGLWCTVLRMSNVVLFFPAILIFCDNKISWKLPGCLMLYALGVLAFNWCFSLFVAPYPDVLYGLMQSDSLTELLRGLYHNTVSNILHFLDPRSDNSLPQAMARYFYLLVLVFLLIKTLLKKQSGKISFTWRWEYFGVLMAGAGCLALVVMIYFVFDWRDYRTLAPMAYFMVLWLLLRWQGEGRSFRCALAALLVFGALMAPDSYRHAAADDRFFPDGSTGLDYSALFSEGPCTLGLYGYDFSQALAKDVPPQVGICIGIFGEDSHGYGMDYILCRPGDPSPSEEYYSIAGQMEGYGTLYQRTH